MRLWNAPLFALVALLDLRPVLGTDLLGIVLLMAVAGLLVWLGMRPYTS